MEPEDEEVGIHQCLIPDLNSGAVVMGEIIS